MSASFPEANSRNSIAFLRLLLAAMVLYSHAHLLGGFGAESFLSWSRGGLILGTVAVQAFFVLSGALIAASWIRHPSLRRFLWCRLLRLGPGLWVCLAVTALVFGPLWYVTSRGMPSSYFSLDPSPIGYVIHNFFRPRAQISIGSLPAGVPWAGDWNGSLWTLFYEAFCYLMVAALGVAGLLGAARAWGAALLLGLLALFSVWTIASPAGWIPLGANRLFDTPGKALSMYFIAGAVWALFPRIANGWSQTRWLGWLACALLLASWHWPIHRWLGPWIMPPALFWLAARLPFAGFDRHVGGDYSYGLYIYGYPVQQLLAHFGATALGYAGYFAAALSCAGLLAVASWHGVEKPALDLKNLLPSGRPIPRSGA